MMRITRANLERLKEALDEVESARDECENPIEVWLDVDGEDAEDRATAREGLEDGLLLEALSDACQGVVDAIGMIP